MKMKTINQRDWQAFVDALTSVINQYDRMSAKAKGQGSRTVPRDEVLEVHGRFERAAASALGEKRRFWEGHETFLKRIASLSPQGLLDTMRRNGIQIKAG